MARDLFGGDPPTNGKGAPEGASPELANDRNGPQITFPIVRLQRDCRQSIYRRRKITAKLVRLGLEAWRP